MKTVYKNIDGETRTRDYIQDMNEAADMRAKAVFAACAQAIALEDIAATLAAMVATATGGRQAHAPATVTTVLPVTDGQIDKLITILDDCNTTDEVRAVIRSWIAENVKPAPVAIERANPTDEQVDNMIRKLSWMDKNDPTDIDMARWVYRKWAEDVQKVKQ